MLNYAYTNYGGYFWMIALAVITYFVMGHLVSGLFASITKKLASGDKERRVYNAIFGSLFCVAIALAFGKIGNLLFATDVYFMWFVGGGLLAHYANLLAYKYKSAEADAFSKAFIEAMKESAMDVSEDDLPVLTEQIGVIVKAYADNNANSHKNKLRGVASGITGSVEITDDEQKELEKAIAKIKSSGIDTTLVEQAYAKAKADGKITRDEKADLEAVIRAIHKVTNI